MSFLNIATDVKYRSRCSTASSLVRRCPGVNTYSDSFKLGLQQSYVSEIQDEGVPIMMDLVSERESEQSLLR